MVSWACPQRLFGVATLQEIAPPKWQRLVAKLLTLARLRTYWSTLGRALPYFRKLANTASQNTRGNARALSKATPDTLANTDATTLLGPDFAVSEIR